MKVTSIYVFLDAGAESTHMTFGKNVVKRRVKTS